MTRLVFLRLSAVLATLGNTLQLENDFLQAAFDAGRLVSLTDRSQGVTHDLAGDGWALELGDLPFPHGAAVKKNSEVRTTCPNLRCPPAVTTVDQCANACMLTDGCASFTVQDVWRTWGKPSMVCNLHTCEGTFADLPPERNTSAGLKPKLPDALGLTSDSCGQPSVTQPSATAIQIIYAGCQGFMVNLTYELAHDWHFVTKHLALCRKSSSGDCDPAAGFTVRHVNVWPGLQLKDSKLGAMASNPFAPDVFGDTWAQGSQSTASFWRKGDSKAGLFVSVQSPFFDSAEGFGAFRWGSEKERWGSINYGAWQLGAVIDKSRVHSADVENTLNLQASSAKAGSDVALLLEKGGTEVDIAVTLLEGFASMPVVKPLPDGYAGILFGASATSATVAGNATVDGYAAVVSLSAGKQKARLLQLNGPLTSDPKILAEANVNVSSEVPVRIAVHVTMKTAVMSIDDTTVLSADLQGNLNSGVGLLVLHQDVSFCNFSTTADTADSPLVQKDAVLHGHYAPMMKQVPSLGTWHQADSGILGITKLSGKEFPETGIDLGEQMAFTQCVEHFLLDKEMRKSGAVRLHVAWDSNEYQLDMSKPEHREEYKRLIHRNNQLGIKHQIFEPRNTAVSSRWQHTDAWWWEEVLWFQMGIGLRNGSWQPSQPLPPTVQEMMAAFKQEHISPVAYVYPTLAWRAEGEDEWLYDSPNREDGDLGKRASLASPKLQNYLIKIMNSFLNVTGGSGFAWDYGIQGDTRVANLYAEVRGWLRILGALREANPGMVMDHRQIAHRFNAWYHLAGSYSEPIAGDENPESYGAELACLSTDHILADNLRLTNYRYRLQLLPNDRVPGFMFHQTERHFDNGTGDDSAGKPGDKIDSDGNALWKPDPFPDPHTGNYSGVAYSNAVMRQRWHVRDFDYLGYRYSVMSTIGTAGRNLVVANIPARDTEEYDKFPAEDIHWMRKWFDWADVHSAELRRTMPLLGYEFPRLGRADGTVAVANEAGFIFLYNPSPDEASATLRVDESLSLTDKGGSWLFSEIYPQEDGMPLGIWTWADLVTFKVAGGSARIVELKPWTQNYPIAFNVSYTSIKTSSGSISISGASGLTGSSAEVVVYQPASISGISINGHSHSGKAVNCKKPLSGSCVQATVSFNGPPSLRRNARAMPGQEAAITVTSAMLAQLEDRQALYNVTWKPEDLDASWLVPSRLLLYLYVARPTPTLADPIVLIDNEAAKIVRQYNSRGNHAVVPAGGGAASGDTARTFLGWYIDCSKLKPDVKHDVSIKFSWADADRKAHPFLGLFWQNIEDAFTSDLTLKDSDMAVFV